MEKGTNFLKKERNVSPVVVQTFFAMIWTPDT